MSLFGKEEGLARPHRRSRSVGEWIIPLLPDGTEARITWSCDKRNLPFIAKRLLTPEGQEFLREEAARDAGGDS